MWAVDDPMWWHGHEMTFAFSGAVLAGFLLTAVPGWSGMPPVKRPALILLAVNWILVRISLLLVGEQHPLSYGLDILWWLSVTFVLAKPLVTKRLWSNLFFVPVLLGLTVLNMTSYLSASGYELFFADRINSAAALIVISVMLTMGGRLFPIYTARTLGLDDIVSNSKLDIAAAIFTILFTLSWLFFDKTGQTVWPMAFFALMAGSLHLYRQPGWHFLKTFKISLLWSLHLAYLFIALGFIGIAHSLIFAPQNLMLMLHLCTVGGMGMIILSMITRLTLGHSGLPLTAPKSMTVAFVLMLCAVLTRSLLPLALPQWSLPLYSISALCWAAAFALYLWRFTKVLAGH